eukprot:8378531-Pyramimonas_sp.AAC.1
MQRSSRRTVNVPSGLHAEEAARQASCAGRSSAMPAVSVMIKVVSSSLTTVGNWSEEKTAPKLVPIVMPRPIKPLSIHTGQRQLSSQRTS